MKTLQLRCCRANGDRFALPIAEWEERGHRVECVDCLAQCGDCEAGPFVEAEGDFLFADDLAELVRRLDEFQNQCPAPGAAGGG